MKKRFFNILALVVAIMLAASNVVFASYFDLSYYELIDSNGNATSQATSIVRNWQAAESEISIEQESQDPADPSKTALKIGFNNTSKAVEIHSSKIMEEQADLASTVIEFDIYTNSSTVRTNLFISAAYSKSDGSSSGDVFSTVYMRPSDSTSLNKFLQDFDGWQKVTVPANYFPSNVTWWISGSPKIDFDWSAAKYFSIGCSSATTGDIYIRNWKVRYNNAVNTNLEYFKHELITAEGAVTDPYSNPNIHGLKSLVPYWAAPAGAVTVTMSGVDPADDTKTSCNISYSATTQPVEGYFEPMYLTSLNRKYITFSFDLYTNSAEGRNLSLGFRYEDNGDITNSLDISPYIQDISGWQTVSVPLNDYSYMGRDWRTNPWSPIEFDWSKIIALRIGLNTAATASISIRNMNYSISPKETKNYYFNNDEGIINLMDSGTFRPNERPYANDTRVGGVGYVVYTRESLLPEVADGVKCRRIEFKKMNSGWFFGRIDKANIFAGLSTSTNDYALYMRIKTLNTNPMSLILGYTTAWNASTFYPLGGIGDSLKPTTDWQTLIIPLDKFADVSLSAINSIGLDSKGMTPTFYVSDFKLIPIGQTPSNRFDFETIITEDVEMFKHGAVGKDCNGISMSGTAGTINSTYTLVPYAYNDSECPSAYYNTIIKVSTKEVGSGISFDITGHGITNDNYKNKALRLMIKNLSATNTNFRVGRSGNGIRDEFRIDGQNSTEWRYQFIPLERFTNNGELPWSDVNSIFIEAMSCPWDSYQYYFDNVSICTIREGGVSVSDFDLSIADDTASFTYPISNTMLSSYNYTADEMPVIGVFEGNSLNSVKMFADINSFLPANTTTTLEYSYDLPALESGSALVKLFRFNNLSELKPMSDVQIRQYFGF